MTVDEFGNWDWKSFDITPESLKELDGEQLQDLYRWKNSREKTPHRPTYQLGSMRAYAEKRHFEFKELGQDLQRTAHKMLDFRYSGQKHTLKDKLAEQRVKVKKQKRGLKPSAQKSLTASLFTLLDAPTGRR